MTTITIFIFVSAGIFAIDFCAQITRHKKDQTGTKFAGIFPLFLLMLSQKIRRYEEKGQVIKQFFLAFIVVIFLSFAIFFLLSSGIAEETDIMHYGLLLTPLFVLPFFHLIYDLITAHPLSIESSLINFRMRGALGLIMSSNIIFVSLLTFQHVFFVAAHFALAFSALMGVFYLCSRLRKKISCYDAPLKDKNSSFEPLLVHYLASILELFYYFILFSLIFIGSPFEGGTTITESMPFLIPFALLIFTTIIVKISFSIDRAFSVEFYEQKALPISFLFLGVMSIFRYYF